MRKGATVNRNSRGPSSYWQLILYVLVLGLFSMLLAPLSPFWWIVPLVGAAMPIALTALRGRERRKPASQVSAVRTAPADPPAVEVMPAPDSVALSPRSTAAETPLVAPGDPVRNPTLAVGLSERELEVLALLATGKTIAEVAGTLFISAGTVKSHSANIYRKLDVKNRTEAVARSRELGLLP